MAKKREKEERYEDRWKKWESRIGKHRSKSKRFTKCGYVYSSMYLFLDMF